MARNLKGNVGHNSGTPEKPFFDRLLAIETHMAELREDRKELCIEAREADILVGPLKLSVKLHRESEEARLAREAKDGEAERILRAVLGNFVDSPLGEAAVTATVQREEQSRRPRGSKAADALGKAEVSLNSAHEASLAHDPGLAGQVAASMGLSESHNPHDLGTAESAEWIAGHRNEMDERRLSE